MISKDKEKIINIIIEILDTYPEMNYTEALEKAKMVYYCHISKEDEINNVK